MLARLERLDRVLFVDVMGQQHTDALHFGIAQHFVPAREHALHPGRFGALAGELRVEVVNANHLCAASSRERLKMDSSNATHTNECHAQAHANLRLVH